MSHDKPMRAETRGRKPTTGRFESRGELCRAVWNLHLNTPCSQIDIAVRCRISHPTVRSILNSGEGRPDLDQQLSGNHMKQIGAITINGAQHKLHQAFYDNRRPAILIDEGMFGKLTVNVVDQPLAPGCIHVKMWGGNEILREPALATGLFEDTGERVPCGHTYAEVWKFKG